MRPKRRILLIDSDEARLSVTRFLLQTVGYAVESAMSAQDAIDIAADWSPDLIVAQWPSPVLNVSSLLRDLMEAAPGRPSLLIADNPKLVPQDTVASVTVPRSDCGPAALRDRVRTLTARKRGPITSNRKTSHSVSAKPAIERRLA